MPVHPTVRKQALKLRAKKLHHQAMIAEHRDALRSTNDQLRALRPQPKKETFDGT
jgi:plasmid stability protein